MTKTSDKGLGASITVAPYWSLPLEALFDKLRSRPAGLTDGEAAQREKVSGIKPPPRSWVVDVLLFLKQFQSPLTLILILAVVLSALLGEYINTLIILAILLLSGFFSFWQERNAHRAVQKLSAVVQVKATVMRAGNEREIPLHDVVVGDIIVLNAGDIIPGDSVLIAANDLHVNEAPLTGESFPVEKRPGVLPANSVVNSRNNCVFLGTSVVNGSAKAIVITTGRNSELGKIAVELGKRRTETAFEKGIRKFGYMIMQITLALSLTILIFNIYFGKPVTDSILFGLALAVGMAPELLPAIVTITLATGAKRMGAKKVIVKKLSSIQNLGAVDVICSDKTGTLTQGLVEVKDTVDIDGKHSDKVKTLAFLNAFFESGFTNPMDEAIRHLKNVNIGGYEKFDEVPYDFIRKRLSIVVAFRKKHILITKGAVRNVLTICNAAESGEERVIPLTTVREKIERQYEHYSASGFRTIGLAYKDITGDPVINKDDESGLIFLGFVTLFDPVKPGIREMIKQLRDLGVRLKLISGDNKLVTAHVSEEIGLRTDNILTGSDLMQISDEALAVKVKKTDVIAETEPYQKERLVRALQKSGKVVGFIGDGINDVSALKAADVGITVDSAVDIAKETADIVFLEKDLNVLREGILEGRRTFVNTLKYIFVTTSANFGNMLSVAGASLLIPFLPLLPKQILLANFLTDMPAMAIASDRVDAELIRRPRKWETSLIRNFMIIFGLQSSLFDFLTFVTLLWIFKSNVESFRTGWFLESVITEILILQVIRTQRATFKSKGGKFLIVTALLVTLSVFLMPYLPYSAVLGFTTLPMKIILSLVAIALAYGVVAELLKRYFFHRVRGS